MDLEIQFGSGSHTEVFKRRRLAALLLIRTSKEASDGGWMKLFHYHVGLLSGFPMGCGVCWGEKLGTPISWRWNWR